MGITSPSLPATRETDEGASPRGGSNPPRPRRRAAWMAAALAAATSLAGLNPVRAEPNSPVAPPVEPAGAGPSDSPRVASRSTAPVPAASLGPAGLDPIARAKQAVADCQANYARVNDYTCTFVKRERIDGRLSHQHVMEMKVRAKPTSIYFKYRSPNKGREAIYVAGRNGGNVVAHDVGLGKLVAGTMKLDPRGTMAMEDCRHPITEAGIGALIETIARHWNVELTREESKVSFHPDMRIGTHDCTMIETIHPSKHPHFLFHKVRLYIGRDHGLPIRFEAYDWPPHPGAAPELVEEYTYLDLRLNVGLGEHDFDPKNRSYSFGRF